MSKDVVVRIVRQVSIKIATPIGRCIDKEVGREIDRKVHRFIGKIVRERQVGIGRYLKKMKIHIKKSGLPQSLKILEIPGRGKSLNLGRGP